MARAKTTLPEAVEVNANEEAFEHGHAALNQLAIANSEAQSNAQAVALQIGYDGNLSVGGLEDEIRFYQKRTIEDVLEMGKRLLVLRELTPHGEFESRVELLNISVRTAQKFMASTLKFSKANTYSLLSAAGGQSKLLELLVLDDGEIAELANGETVRGISLDSIEKMSVRELKAALKSAMADSDAKDKVIADKSVALDKALVKKALMPMADWPAAFSLLIATSNDAHRIMEFQLGALADANLKAMQAEPADGEEESLKQARMALAQSIGHTLADITDKLNMFTNTFNNTLADIA
ncbi:MAG: DUF3102 domain-containing protein [Methylotenera sp.]|nr:DUF3102 domain-containing protein [Methylotenera sp.]